MERLGREGFEEFVNSMPVGKNKSFTSSAMNLWTRFTNWEKHPPFVLRVGGEIVSFCMITVLKKGDYANLYEIASAEGHEGKGYASTLYWQIMEHMAHTYHGIRLKMSCTPTSIGWHFRNGIIGYGVDPSGSIRVDVPISATKADQLQLREMWKVNPEFVLPPPKSREKLLKENPKFGTKKSVQVDHSILTMGEYYLRGELQTTQETICQI